MKAIVQGGSTIASLGERIPGRTTAEDIVDTKSGEVIVASGVLLDEPMVAKIEAANTRRSRSAARWSADRRSASAANAMAVTSLAVRR